MYVICLDDFEDCAVHMSLSETLARAWLRGFRTMIAVVKWNGIAVPLGCAEPNRTLCAGRQGMYIFLFC